MLLGFAVLPAYGQALPGSGSLPLRSAVEIALANSAQLQVARSAVSIADLQIREAYSGVYPQVSVEASYLRSLGAAEQVVTDGKTSQREPQQGNRDNTWSASLKLNQTVLDVRVFSGLDAAEGLRGLRGEELRGAAQQVVDTVRQRYFGALLAEEQERLTEQSIARLQQTLRETRARHREGFASDDELLRLEVQLANLDSNLLQARNRVATARGALLVAMSEDPLQAVALQGTLSELRLAPAATNSPANADLLAAAGAGPLLATGAEQLRRIAMTNRSDLRQLRTLHTLGELQLTIQEAAYLPTIRAFGSVDFGTADDDDDAEFGAPIGASGYSQWRLSAAAGLAVQWQLFSGFARDARVAQRREELRQSAARLRQAEREALHQVHTSGASLQEARARAASQRRSIEHAQQSYDIAATRYGAGVGSELQVIAAEATLRESQFDYARAVYDYLAAASRLELAIGRVPLADVVPAAPVR